MAKIKLLAVFVIAYSFIFPTSLSAELDKYQYDIIRVAFLNGYASAVKNDIEALKGFKEDKEKLKKKSQLDADSYLNRVVQLNDGTMGNSIAGNNRLKYR